MSKSITQDWEMEPSPFIDLMWHIRGALADSYLPTEEMAYEMYMTEKEWCTNAAQTMVAALLKHLKQQGIDPGVALVKYEQAFNDFLFTKNKYGQPVSCDRKDSSADLIVSLDDGDWVLEELHEDHGVLTYMSIRRYDENGICTATDVRPYDDDLVLWCSSFLKSTQWQRLRNVRSTNESP